MRGLRQEPSGVVPREYTLSSLGTRAFLLCRPPDIRDLMRSVPMLDQLSQLEKEALTALE